MQDMDLFTEDQCATLLETKGLSVKDKIAMQ